MNVENGSVAVNPAIAVYVYITWAIYHYAVISFESTVFFYSLGREGLKKSR